MTLRLPTSAPLPPALPPQVRDLVEGVSCRLQAQVLLLQRIIAAGGAPQAAAQERREVVDQALDKLQVWRPGGGGGALAAEQRAVERERACPRQV